MKNIISIFISDIKGLVKNILALVIAIGLCFLPSLYAWFNIYSNWDPYANTSNIRMAAVTEDEGYTMEDGTTENMGQEVVEELKHNEAIGWEIVDTSQEAIEGVKSGKYYAAVVIESDFTYKLYNVLAEGFENPGITYYENEKKNAVATKITDTAVSTLQSTIDRKFIEVVTSKLFEKANTVSSELEEQEKMDEFLAKISDINEKLLAYDDTIDSLLTGNEALTASVNEADGEIESLREDVEKGIQNLQEVENNVSGTRTSLADFNENVNSTLSTIEASLNNISANITDAGLAGKTQAAVDHMIQTSQDVDALQDQLAELKEALTGIQNSEGSTPELEGTIQNALDTITSISGGAEDIQNMIDSLGDLNGEFSNEAGISSNLTETLVNAKTEQITAAISNCAASVSNMKNMYSNNLVPEISNVLNGTAELLGNAADILITLDETLGNTKGIFSGVITTVDGTNESLRQIQSILHSVSGKLTEILDKLNSVSDDERVQALIEILQGNPDSYGEYFSEPVKVETKQIYPIENYGSAMTPFYTVLSLWVGALLLTALIKVKAEPKNLTEVKPRHLFFGRYLLFFLLGQIQTGIVVLGDIYLLNCQILNKGMFYLTAVITSFVFTLLIYALTLSFGDIGKALAVVMVVIQIAGSSGTFPIELLPEVYRNIYIFFPFPYAINAMRETIGGMYGSTYVTAMSELLVFAAAALAIGLIIRKPFIKINHFVEKRMEDTKMM